MNRLIAIGAASYAGLGLVSFLKPGTVPAVIGSTAPNADSRTEIRAVYGGLPLGLAASLVAAPSSATAVGVATAGWRPGGPPRRSSRARPARRWPASSCSRRSSRARCCSARGSTSARAAKQTAGDSPVRVVRART